jgi:DNA-binding NarL/FixJ family response regulator
MPSDTAAPRREAQPEGIGRPLRLLVVDDHDVVHWGFRLMLGGQPWVERCLAARTGDEAVALARRYEPHVALVDLFVGDESGSEICERLLAAWPWVKVLFISGAGQISATAARACGASGFVPKDRPAPEILAAVKTVARGEMAFAAEAAPPRGLRLTAREREVLELVATGRTNQQIAEELHLSRHTVKEHASRLFRKLEARNRAEAVQRAQRLGLLA